MAEMVFIGLGSNLGDRLAYIQSALNYLAKNPAVKLIATSAAYTTAPEGYLDQPPFLNAAAALQTTLPPPDLLDALLAIEAAHQRRRRIHWGPRTLDLDMLLYGQRLLNTPSLSVPHPFLTERRFFLAPLCQIAPALRHPGSQCLLSTYLRRCSDLSPMPIFSPLHLP